MFCECVEPSFDQLAFNQFEMVRSVLSFIVHIECGFIPLLCDVVKRIEIDRVIKKKNRFKFKHIEIDILLWIFYVHAYKIYK